MSNLYYSDTFMLGKTYSSQDILDMVERRLEEFFGEDRDFVRYQVGIKSTEEGFYEVEVTASLDDLDRR